MVYVFTKLNVFIVMWLDTVKPNLILQDLFSFNNMISFIIERSIFYLIYVNLQELQL